MSYIRIVNKRPHGPKPQSGELVISVDRTHPVLGNPFRLADPSNPHQRQLVIAQYTEQLERDIERKGPIYRALEGLAEVVQTGQPLALQCWCAPAACHGDVIKSYLATRLGRDLDPPKPAELPYQSPLF